MTPTNRQLSRIVRFTIFRSYGAILQSSFGIIISIVLAYNASPPVSVLGTVGNTVLNVLHGQLIFLAPRPHTILGVVNQFAGAKMIAKNCTH